MHVQFNSIFTVRDRDLLNEAKQQDRDLLSSAAIRRLSEVKSACIVVTKQEHGV